MIGIVCVFVGIGEDCSDWAIVIGLSISLPILIVATNNLVTGLVATLTLVCITVTVSGLINAAGWRLGVSTTLVLLV